METKQCSVCRKTKPLSEFNVRYSKLRPTLRADCKRCEYARQTKKRKKKTNALYAWVNADSTKVCTSCNKAKHVSEFSKSKNSCDGFGNRCKSCRQNRRDKKTKRRKGIPLLWNNEYFDKKLIERRPGWVRIGNFVDVNTPVEVRCPRGHTINMKPTQVSRGGNGCKECKSKWDNDYTDEWLKINKPGWKRLTDVDGVFARVEFICDKGHKIIKGINNLASGCYMCSGKLYWDNDRFDSLLPEGWKRISDVTNSTCHVKILCPRGHKCKTAPKDLQSNKFGCRTCATELQKKWDNAYFDKELALYKPGWLRIGDVENSAIAVSAKCDKGHDVLLYPLHIKKYGCQKCAFESRAKWDNDSIDELLRMYKQGFKRIGDVIAGTKVKIACPNGHESNKTPYDIINQIYGCRQCADEERKIWNTLYYDEQLSIHRPGWKRLGGEVNSGFDPILVACEKGHEQELKPYNMRKGGCMECFRESQRDESISDEEREIARNYPEYREWRTSVYKRDDYTCVCCGNLRGGNLNAHHLDGYEWCVERRTDVSNGVTLCENCHIDFHRIYGYGGNTYEQFDEWFFYRELQKYDFEYDEVI